MVSYVYRLMTFKRNVSTVKFQTTHFSLYWLRAALLLSREVITVGDKSVIHL